MTTTKSTDDLTFKEVADRYPDIGVAVLMGSIPFTRTATGEWLWADADIRAHLEGVAR